MTLSSKKTILVVDSDPATRTRIETALNDSFSVLCAESGVDALMQIQVDEPDMVLLDIELPGMDGYETCQQIRQHSNIPVIFVSASNHPENRIKALEVGGDDFVDKPFDSQFLALKVAKMLAPHVRAEIINVEKQAMQSMAMDLLTITNEGRTLLDFMISNLNSRHHEELADSVINIISSYGLHGFLEIRHPEGVTRRSVGIAISPLEEPLMGDRQAQQGVFVFRQKLMVNKPNSSVMIPNMPTDAELAGRLQQNIVMLMEATESLISTIDMRKDTALKTESLQVAAFSAHSITQSLQNDYHQQQADTRILLYSLIDKVEKSYFSLGLTEGQEERISQLLRGESEGILELFKKGNEDFDQKFAAIMAALAPPQSSDDDVWL